VSESENSTIALLGTDNVVGKALSLQKQREGYEITMVEAPPTGPPEDLMEGVDLLLISPGLVHERCEESLAVLRGKRSRMGVPVLELSSLAVGEGFLHDEGVRVVPWPINIEGLAREIEGALNVSTHHETGWNSTASPSP